MNKIANEVEIVVTSHDKSGPGLASARASTRKFGAELKQTLSKAGQDAGAALGKGIVQGVTAPLRDAKGRFIKALLPGPGESEREGRSLGRRVVSAVAGGMAATAGVLKSAFVGTLQAAVSKPVIVGVLLAVLGGVAAVLGPALATLIAGSMVLGIGGAVVGIGVALLSQNKKVKADFKATWSEIKTIMTDAAKPLIPVLDTVRAQTKSVVKDLAPEIEEGFKSAQKPMRDFVRDLGSGFKELKPSIGPLFDSFGQVLNELGPQLPGIFQSISDSVVTLSATVSENKDLIAAVFVGLLNTIPMVIDLMSTLTGMFRGALSAFLGFTDGVLGAVQSVMESFASIPGPWQESAAAMAASIQGTRDKFSAWRQDIENFPKIVKLEGEIRDLETKISRAKARLNDPDLTRERRAAIKANIANLQAGVSSAKAALASIRDRHVSIFHRNVYVNRAPSVGVLAPGRAHGGIIGGLGGIKRFASGGVSGAGSSLAMVGEQGPELVRLPVGSSVTSAGQTQAQMSRSGGGNSISMAFMRSPQQAGGALSSIAEAALKVVVTLREAMAKLTGGIFGQERALTAYEAAWDNAKKSLKDNKKTLNISTSAGRENRGALLSLAEAAHDVAAQMHELGKPASSVIAKMREQRNEFIKMARSMGLTSKQAKSLADRYGLIPSKVKTAISAEAKNTAYNANLPGKASGGIAGGWTMVGERGAELVRLPFGSQVTSANQTQAMLAGGGLGRGGGDIHITLMIGTTKLGEIIIDPLRNAVSSRGGNVQAVLGGR